MHIFMQKTNSRDWEFMELKRGYLKNWENILFSSGSQQEDFFSLEQKMHATLMRSAL